MVHLERSLSKDMKFRTMGNFSSVSKGQEGLADWWFAFDFWQFFLFTESDMLIVLFTEFQLLVLATFVTLESTGKHLKLEENI